MHRIADMMQVAGGAVLALGVMCFLGGLVIGVAVTIGVGDLERRRREAFDRWLNREADRGLELLDEEGGWPPRRSAHDAR